MVGNHTPLGYLTRTLTSCYRATLINTPTRYLDIMIELASFRRWAARTGMGGCGRCATAV
jgi:hypothetical protein